MITLEGLKVKANEIPAEQLVSVWKTLSEEPFPKVKAFQLEDNDFERIIKRRKCWGDVRRELLEWGRVLTVKGTDACIFNADEFIDTDYVILIRSSPYHGLAQIIRHELRHIARGDL